MSLLKGIRTGALRYRLYGRLHLSALLGAGILSVASCGVTLPPVAQPGSGGTSATPPPPKLRDVDALGWLTGGWLSTDGGVITEEYWIAPSGGLILGMNRVVANGDAVFHEFLRIDGRHGAIAYQASPGGAGWTTFHLTDLGPAKAVFENAYHDWPQQIVYELSQDDVMTVTVNGMERGQQRVETFRMKRIVPPPPPPPVQQ